MRDDRTVGCAHLYTLCQSRKRVFIERRSTIRRREFFRRLRVTRLLEIDDDAMFLLNVGVVIFRLPFPIPSPGPLPLFYQFTILIG